MSTAQTIINNALRLLNLNSLVKGVDPYHQQIAFQVLVDWLATERGKRIYITPQIPASVNSDLKEKPYAKKAIEYAVAYDLIAPLQVRTPPLNIVEIKRDSYATLYVNAKPRTSMQLPDTLPLGSGNQRYSFSFNYYADNDSTIYDIYDSVNVGDASIFYADFDAGATLKSTTVSSVEWTILENSGVTISNESLSSNLASAQFTFTGSGSQKVKALATYASGEKKTFMFSFQVAQR